MNVRWVILFAEVAQDGSFTRAAARLNLAQPWLSAQVRKLETELGVTLFTRRRRRIELTAEGARLLPCARQIAESSRQFRALAREIGADRSTVVRIGAHVPAIGVRQFAQLNDDFAARYPRFAFEISNAPTADLLASVHSGALDIALVLAPFDDNDLETVSLRRAPAFLLAPRRAPWGSAPVASLALIRDRAVAVMPRDRHPAFFDQALAPLAAAGARLRPVAEFDGRAMEHLVRSEGVPVVMIEGDAETFAQDRDLIALPLDPPVTLEHDLVRRRDALAGRAADRYWRLAQSFSAPD